MTEPVAPAEEIDLAREPDFHIGGLLVSPSAGRVHGGGGEQRVEPRVMQVLVVLVRHAGRTVTRDQLIDACWGGRVVSDDAVTRVLAQVRALGRSFDPAPFTLETVPKVGFRLIPEAAPGESVAPSSAAASQRPGPTPAPARPGKRRRVALAAVAGLLVLAVAGGLAWHLANPQPVRGPGQNGRIYVMMFTPQDADPALSKVAEDLSASIVRVLSGAGAQVAERPLPRDAAQSGAELRVAGSVERDGGDLVVNPQILDRASGQVLWSDRMVQTPQDRALAPGRPADDIAAVLHCALEDRKTARAPVSTEAFGLYLNACAGVFLHGDNPGRTLAVTRRLVKAAPAFAAAHAMHAIAAANAANDLTHSPEEAAALHAEAKAAAATALRIDPRTAKAYSGLALNEGALSDRSDQNWYLVEQYVTKALKLDPDLPPARNEYATMLRATGRLNEALEVLRTADEKDPRAGGDPRVVVLSAATGDLAGAEARLTELEATYRQSLNSTRWAVAFWWEDPKAALAKLDSLVPASRKADADCFRTYLRDLDVRKASHAHGLTATCDSVDANWRVRMLSREGDVDGAFAGLGGRVADAGSHAGMAEHARASPLIFYYPEMRAVRADPRFWALARSMGLTDYWRKSGHWPDFCAEPGLPYDCRKAAAAADAARPAST